jgi:rSAM/selenodomain-associated transferase 1
LRLPFGDQGFCLSNEQFCRLGGFNESLQYGEDHDLIWRAHRAGISVKRVPAPIATSARKYRREGWLRTTGLHLWRTINQAAPQFLRLSKARVKSIAKKTRPASEERLIVFARCPELGRCKTRLIPHLGEDGATALHEALVKHTMGWIGRGRENVKVEVRYCGADLARLRTLCGVAADNADFVPQKGEGLGSRLSEAATAAFDNGAAKVAIVGTDCPDLSWHTIKLAFYSLDSADVVLGPAKDGGYYLVALRAAAPLLFQDIDWGSVTVLQDTLINATRLGLSVNLLTELGDIDRPDDLTNLRDRLRVQLECRNATVS